MGAYYSNTVIVQTNRSFKVDVYSQNSVLTINISEQANGYYSQNALFMVPIDQIIGGIDASVLIEEILKRGLFESIKDYKKKS